MDRFTKQPVEVIDYDFDFTDWLSARADVISSAEAEAETGLIVGTVTVTDGVVKVFVSGGDHGFSYKLTCTVTTAGTRVKQSEATIRVREI